MPSNQLFQKIKSRIEIDIENKNSKDKIEKTFYEGLSECLKLRQFESFKELFSNSVNFDIFIDVEKIPYRFEIILNLLMNCIQEVSVGYQTSSLGDIIDILWFCNKYNLLERENTPKDLVDIEEIKKDKLLIENLRDLFGEVSNSLIFYVSKIMPQNLYNYFVGNQNPVSFYTDVDQLVYYIRNSFFNNYSIYGLSVKYLGTAKKLLRELEKKKIISTVQKDASNKHLNGNQADFVEFSIVYKYGTNYFNVQEEWEDKEIKKHLISPENISKNLPKILEKGYNFFSLSMVLLGGIGPQGHGFTYSTPKGEVIEICSDVKENEAIIVKYKQFLKQQFLERLKPEMQKLNIDAKVIHKVTNYLTEVLNNEELINYYKKGRVLKTINNFFSKTQYFQNSHREEVHSLINKISNAISVILRPISMVDQFKCRMDLISEEKIQSEDIAKLTSLRNKSHYDILRERFFYQYIVEWFYQIFLENKQS